MKTAVTYDSPAGRLWLAEENGAVTNVAFSLIPGAESNTSPLLQETLEQLEAYFSGGLHTFSIPLRPSGTPFQQACWQALRDIPYGHTRTYSDLAAAVNNPKACRAVGMANNKNPIAILIPCHRVIGKNGGLVGYGGGLEVKRMLLELEKQYR